MSSGSGSGGNAMVVPRVDTIVSGTFLRFARMLPDHLPVGADIRGAELANRDSSFLTGTGPAPAPSLLAVSNVTRLAVCATRTGE